MVNDYPQIPGFNSRQMLDDLGTSERVAGLTYVALSRVCKIFDLVIEPVTFDRLHSLKKTSNYKYRLLEEARLERLAQDTLSKHSEKK